MEDYYQILGISPRATQLEVRRSFRKLAVLYHPDKNNAPEAEEQFKQINRAYEVLNNVDKRAQYDLSLVYPLGQAHTAQPRHRDPAYHRNPAVNYAQRDHKQTTQELMAEYLPKFRWACWIGLVICLLLTFDYLLPYQQSVEDIVEINRMYRTGRGGGTIYDHDELITKNGITIYLQDEDLSYFKKARQIIIQKSPLFKKIVTAATADEAYKIRVASIYGNLVFVPIILMIASSLGVALRNSVEFSFNLTIVSFILLLIVMFLLLR
jgi:hypothetical protein